VKTENTVFVTQLFVARCLSNEYSRNASLFRQVIMTNIYIWDACDRNAPFSTI